MPRADRKKAHGTFKEVWSKAAKRTRSGNLTRDQLAIMPSGKVVRKKGLRKNLGSCIASCEAKYHPSKRGHASKRRILKRANIKTRKLAKVPKKPKAPKPIYTELLNTPKKKRKLRSKRSKIFNDRV